MALHAPAYLHVSRHRVFYLRWPLPKALHPQGRPSTVKVSLGRRLSMNPPAMTANTAHPATRRAGKISRLTMRHIAHSTRWFMPNARHFTILLRSPTTLQIPVLEGHRDIDAHFSETDEASP
ncbi:hypothetical protein [Magnetospirillum sp. LM-5]|uniref:hypothetical protein n=1 Tax=Magnetospirillum sp. LM-5 TaxID=2681466 RepID=UPI00156DB1B8|nr:hypothetical protein [Magnetospirillum sp. LM-5]